MKSNVTFSFGRNWLVFLKTIDEERIQSAKRSLTDFLGIDSFAGKTFIDIGCGSGLFSLAAFRLGSDRIVSFDVDPSSVHCCEHLRAQAGSPGHWQIYQGSVLDSGFLSSLGTFDIVYSWGALHHTGRMWDAVQSSAELVCPEGHYYIALYNKILGRSGSPSWIHPFWLGVKRLYNTHPAVGAYVLEPFAMAAYLAMVVARLENPVRHVRNYKSHRGMSWRTDATDWLGGYPYEFATVEEVFKFVKIRFPEFNLVNLQVTSGRGLNWYLFRRSTVVLAGSYLAPGGGHELEDRGMM